MLIKRICSGITERRISQKQIYETAYKHPCVKFFLYNYYCTIVRKQQSQIVNLPQSILIIFMLNTMLHLVAFDTVHLQSSYYIFASQRHISPWIFRTCHNIPKMIEYILNVINKWKVKT